MQFAVSEIYCPYGFEMFLWLSVRFAISKNLCGLVQLVFLESLQTASLWSKLRLPHFVGVRRADYETADQNCSFGFCRCYHINIFLPFVTLCRTIEEWSSDHFIFARNKAKCSFLVVDIQWNYASVFQW